MVESAAIRVENNDPVKAVESFIKSVLALADISAVMTPRHLPGKSLVMPVLVSRPEQLIDVDPLAPSYALNAAKMVCRLTRKPLTEKIAVMLRPCEIRAFVELVKLKQGSRDNLVIIGADCLGAYGNKAYIQYKEKFAQKATALFYQSALGDDGGSGCGMALTPACQSCASFLPDGADVAIGLLGADISRRLPVYAQTPAGETLLESLDLPDADVPKQRRAAIKALQARRVAAWDRMTAATTAATGSLEKLGRYLANCVNCYNCRVACPVCYCRECVFVTDVFDHEPLRYLGWAKRKGAVKMPTDTLFYHLTRMAHISTACVGCGQCTNACPNEVPVMELFRTVALGAQAAFDYEAGRRLEDKPPLSEFKEKEFEEVVGIQ